MNDLNNIPKIKFDEEESSTPLMNTGGLKTNQENPNTEDKSTDHSILIPKVETENNLPRENKKLKRIQIKKLFSGKKRVILLGVIVFFFILLSLFLNVFLKAKKVYSHTITLKAAVASQDFNQVRNELGETKKSLQSLSGAFKLVSWLKIIPFVGGYVSDTSHIISASLEGMDSALLIVDAIEPYADLIGFKSDKIDGSVDNTASDRIDFIVKTLPTLVPKIDEIDEKLSMVKKDVDQINPKRYPEQISGKKIRENIEQAITLVDQVSEFITNGKPLIAKAEYLLGLNEPRTYLVLFQNDKELRPTGGFMTAYSIMKVDKAKFEPVSSDDIYHLDAKYKASIEAPEPIVDYLKGPYVLSNKLKLRDMNWSPDFYESMKLFLTEAEKTGLDEVDGIVAVDTQALVNVLEIIGPIGVSGFGNFSTDIISECNCPQVIYELESFADVEGPVVWDPAGTGKIIYQPPNADNRKKIIGPLMNSIMANTLGQPKEKYPDLFQALYKSLIDKNVLFYLNDSEAQDAVESFGIAGKITEVEGDYLNIVDANLGGRKSNLYVTQEIHQDIKVAKDGSVEKVLTITYKNTEKYDGWLNSVLPNWVRIYVPKGTELKSFEGVEDSPKPYEELGKTVFAGYFELRPQGVVKLVVTYKLPFKVKDKYEMLIQKQPGKSGFLYTTTLGKTSEEILLESDKRFVFDI